MKLVFGVLMGNIRMVAPRRGAWIETKWIIKQVGCQVKSHPAGVRGLKQSSRPKAIRPEAVAPRRGAWIETHDRTPCPHANRQSHPAGVRGLKPHGDDPYWDSPHGRTPQGCVD